MNDSDMEEVRPEGGEGGPGDRKTLFVMVHSQETDGGGPERKKISTPPGMSSSTQALLRALHEKDNYTWGHSRRVTTIALKLGSMLGVAPAHIEQLALGGWLHDIGKIVIPASLLNKEKTLSREELERIRNHAHVGSELIKSLENSRAVARLVRHHHERWDGTGYPDSLEGADIPLPSRILGVADAFDAMASQRPYRDRLDKQEIIREFRQGRGRQFAPNVTDRFLVWYEGEGADEEFPISPAALLGENAWPTQEAGG
mgnify:CR=1 FL=1